MEKRYEQMLYPRKKRPTKKQVRTFIFADKIKEKGKFDSMDLLTVAVVAVVLWIVF